MSGGAGKVYFILYLAVILELLIIIVERDEAEEHLHKKQKETMKIVESILAQLYSGSGTEGMNTRPQDVITMFEQGLQNSLEKQGVKIRRSRRYIVEVGVTDVIHEWKQKEEEGETEQEYLLRKEKLIDLANVAQLQYQVFFNPSTDENQPPAFKSDDQIEKENIDFTSYEGGEVIPSPDPEAEPWVFKGYRELEIDPKETYNQNLIEDKATNIHPIYQPIKKGPGPDPFFAPDGMQDSIFYYSEEITHDIMERKGSKSSGINKRAFVVNFHPPEAEAGWYKLRFVSQTNRILGIRKDADAQDIDEDETVNIGTVQLTVGDLEKVQSMLYGQFNDLPDFEKLKSGDMSIDVFSDQIDEAIRETSNTQDAAKIKLYGYISKLLTPGASFNFDQNRNNLEFNVFVVKPPIKTGPISMDVPKNVHLLDAVFNSKESNGTLFRFFANNYDDSDSDITGIIEPEEGSPYKFTVINKGIVGAEGKGGSLGEGKKVEFWAVTDRKVEGKEGRPNILNAKLTFRKGSQTDNQEVKVYIHRTGVDRAKSMKKLFDIRSYYGETLLYELYPLSAGKIPSSSFVYKIKMNTDNETRTIENTKITGDDNIIFPCSATQASLQFFWKHPVTAELIKVFPLDEESLSADLSQKPPSINGGYQAQLFDNDPFSPYLIIDNINIAKTNLCGDSEKQIQADKDLKVDIKVTNLDAKGYYAVASATISPIDEDETFYKYQAIIYLTGEPPNPDDFFNLPINLQVEISASITNKYATKNNVGKSSAPRSYSLQLKVPEELE